MAVLITPDSFCSLQMPVIYLTALCHSNPYPLPEKGYFFRYFLTQTLPKAQFRFVIRQNS